MGAINYSSNDTINIGVNPDNYWIENENGNTEFLDFEIAFDYKEITNLLNQYDFEYFTVKIEPGYYEGFYIDIDFDYLWVDSYEKPLIQKEITQLKCFLNGCIERGLVQYSPGWCTGYYSAIETRKNLDAAIKELRQIIRKYHTYKTYNKGA